MSWPRKLSMDTGKETRTLFLIALQRLELSMLGPRMSWIIVLPVLYPQFQLFIVRSSWPIWEFPIPSDFVFEVGPYPTSKVENTWESTVRILDHHWQSLSLLFLCYSRALPPAFGFEASSFSIVPTWILQPESMMRQLKVYSQMSLRHLALIS